MLKQFVIIVIWNFSISSDKREDRSIKIYQIANKQVTQIPV